MKHITADDGRILTPPKELEALLKGSFPAFYKLLGHMRWFYMTNEIWDGNSSLVFKASDEQLSTITLGDGFFDIEIADESFRVENETALNDIFGALKKHSTSDQCRPHEQLAIDPDGCPCGWRCDLCLGSIKCDEKNFTASENFGYMKVNPPFTKKHFSGELYAAHMIPMGAFEEWGCLSEWANNNDRFLSNVIEDDGECMYGLFEEHLNFRNMYEQPGDDQDYQIDLLFPIKPKFATSIKHPQERIVDTIRYNSMSVEVVQWDETIWCGKMECAKNNTDEPDMGKVSDDFSTQNPAAINKRLEAAANTLLHFDFLTSERPATAMFAFLVNTEKQPDGFDVKKVPPGQYMRLDLSPESAEALGVDPWDGGAPPVEWISERLAPQFGYRQIFDLPFTEYYGFKNGSSDEVVNAFLYVPVEKIYEGE